MLDLPSKNYLLGRIREEEDCWIFAHKGKPGKGVIVIGGKSYQPTKIAWAVLLGEPFPFNQKVIRTCSNKDCINPDHLKLAGFSRQRAIPFEERFLQKVKKSDGCWEWIGTRDEDGYGKARDEDGTMHPASRIAYRMWIGDPGEDFVCHKCDNPPCVNPEHLFLGSGQVNQRDKWSKGRGVNNAPRGETHPCTKFTESDIHRIRELYDTGQKSTIQLGRDYGVSDESIRQIVRRKTWRHLTETGSKTELSERGGS